MQAGLGDDRTTAYLIGVTWGWNWRYRFPCGLITGYADADFGRWTTHRVESDRSAWATQIGVTPVIRVEMLGRLDRWFSEIGVGPNYIVPLFRTGHKRFSTEFNFGDHVAIGHMLGGRDRQELALRVQHFSNAGIGHPNPGENFVQMRYALRL